MDVSGGDSQGCFHLFGVQEAFLFTDTKQSEILPWEMDVRRTCVTAYGFCADGGGISQEKRVRGSQQSEDSELRSKVPGRQACSSRQKPEPKQRSFPLLGACEPTKRPVTPSWGPVTPIVSGGLSRLWDSSKGRDPLCLSFHASPSSAASPHTCFSENALAVYLMRP